jgi:heat shock protein HslJ
MALFMATIPATAAAQDTLAGPEGVRWDLTAYGVDGEMVTVPWTIDATMTLEDGTASGSSGCNQFTVDYSLDGETLTFAESIALTRMACPEDQTVVESNYMAALPTVSTWSMVDEGLALADTEGEIVLEFSQPLIGLTASDIAGIVARFDLQQAEIDRLTKAVEGPRARKLRERVKTLENQVKRLRNQVAKLESTARGRAVSFTKAEKVLLEGIPTDIARTCEPRRRQNPRGTLAAVQCKPVSPVVKDMAYYLMSSAAAGRVWDERMRDHGVEDGPGECWNGQPDAVYYTPGPDVDGCYVNDDGIANLRYVANAAGCSQLNVAGRQLKDPAIYVAVLGHDDDIAKLTRWAQPKRGGSQILTQTIERPALPAAARCGG